MTGILYVGHLVEDKVRYIAIALVLALAGCATDAASPPVQPVTIAPSDFCRVMRGILPPSGKPTWSIDDTAETRTDARKIGAAVDARCGVPGRVAARP